jgi:hypothetical protein
MPNQAKASKPGIKAAPTTSAARREKTFITRFLFLVPHASASVCSRETRGYRTRELLCPGNAPSIGPQL